MGMPTMQIPQAGRLPKESDENLQEEMVVKCLDRKDCPMRMNLFGNCKPLGRYCITVNENMCKVLKLAYEHGKHDGVEQYLREREEDQELE